MGKEGIVLIGMAGAGKSTIGSALANTLGFSFTDLDEYIREKDGKTVQDIINTSGEETLLLLEKQSMYEIELNRRVIAPGGSIIYHPDLMEYLKRRSVLIYLDDTFENIERRLKNVPNRGIIGLKSKSLRKIYDERRPLYSKYAHIVVHPEGNSQQQVISEIINQYMGLMK